MKLSDVSWRVPAQAHFKNAVTRVILNDSDYPTLDKVQMVIHNPWNGMYRKFTCQTKYWEDSSQFWNSDSCNISSEMIFFYFRAYKLIQNMVARDLTPKIPFEKSEKN